jgi:carbon monoxide dehydrogenase subunit G
MQLTNEFVVPRGIDETWAVLTDVERIAPAMPGAQLTGVQDGKYSGKVKIKVGPVTAAYAGVASFREKDAVNHHMVLDATGKESNGRGRAAAIVTADLVADGGDTKVKVTTDLTISGPLAQFGRGAIVEVSNRLLNQFVANLKETVLADSPATTPAAATEAAPTPDANAAETDASPVVTETSSAALSEPSSATAATPVNGAVAATPAPATPAAPVAPAPPARPAPAPAAEVNLLKVAAWPILKRVIPLLIVIVVIVVLIVWLA